MLKIRLKRVGRIHDPSYRIVAVEAGRGPQTGQIVETLGFYDPRHKENIILKTERIRYRLSCGAQASDTVHNILVKKSVIEGKKRDRRSQKIARVKTESTAPSSVLVANDSPSDESMRDKEPEETVTA